MFYYYLFIFSVRFFKAIVSTFDALHFFRDHASWKIAISRKRERDLDKKYYKKKHICGYIFNFRVFFVKWGALFVNTSSIHRYLNKKRNVNYTYYLFLIVIFETGFQKISFSIILPQFYWLFIAIP